MSLPSLESTSRDFLDKDLQWESLLFLLDDHHLTLVFRQAMLVRFKAGRDSPALRSWLKQSKQMRKPNNGQTSYLEQNSAASSGAWLKQSGTLFGPGGIAGWNLWNHKIKQSGSPVHASDMWENYDASKTRCSYTACCLKVLSSIGRHAAFKLAASFGSTQTAAKETLRLRFTFKTMSQ